MNRRIYIYGLLLAMLVSSCGERWNEHYEEAELTMDGSVTLYRGTMADYLQQQSDLTILGGLMKQSGLLETLDKNHQYTLIVYPDGILQESAYRTDTSFASYCLCDIAVAPSMLADGLGLRTRMGKNIWVYEKADGFYLDEYPIEKVVKTDNAYLYYVEEAVIPVRQSVYDVFNNLGEDYSEFKRLVRRYEETYFDKENSTPIGFNASGNTIYKDSVWAVKNKLMDRYTEEGVDYWNMRSEDFVTTMFIPSNEVIQVALDSARARLPRWLGRPFNNTDLEKFEKWIVRACFIDQRIEPDVMAAGNDINCVGGYIRDTTSEEDDYDQMEAAMWRPTVQLTDNEHPVYSSNGISYYVNSLKIPNNVIIYRLKSRFYQLWGAMNTEQRSKYFRWTHWIDPMVVDEAQGSFELSPSLPTMYYNVLTAMPDKEAMRDSLECSVTYDGLLYNESNRKVTEVCLPPGEYYLRMGFKHSLLYSLSISFNDSLLIKDMVMYAQGSNYHFDRGSVSVTDYYGEMSIGYPEGYNWKDWIAVSEKAQAYDTDGYQVAVVRVFKEGNFTITISSSDMSYLYDATAARDKSNVKQLMMYHWCLRPTRDNY